MPLKARAPELSPALARPVPSAQAQSGLLQQLLVPEPGLSQPAPVEELEPVHPEPGSLALPDVARLEPRQALAPALQELKLVQPEPAQRPAPPGEVPRGLALCELELLPWREPLRVGPRSFLRPKPAALSLAPWPALAAPKPSLVPRCPDAGLPPWEQKPFRSSPREAFGPKSDCSTGSGCEAMGRRSRQRTKE